MVSADVSTPDDVTEPPETQAAGNRSGVGRGEVAGLDDVVVRTGLRGKPRRSWPQRLLMVSGLLVAAACFGAAFVFWQASVVLSEVPRISVGPDVLAQAGDPGEPVSLLLVGVDSSEGLDPDDPVRVGRDVEDEARGIVRPDTILVVRLDPATGAASVLSLPRDLIVEVEGGTTTRLNATQTIGGIGALITAIDDNLSIPVNHFVIADFAGFSDIVDIVGGVPIYFPYPTRDLGSGLAIADTGCWNLTGSESLSYVRARSIEEFIEGEWVPLAAASPDLARIERQQEFLVLTAEEILAIGRRDLSRISSFIDAGAQAVQLDEELTPGDMAGLAEAFSDFNTEELQIATLPVAASFSEAGTYLGEEVVALEAADLLARFQGLDDGVRPPEVELLVLSNQGRHSEELAERGFVAEGVESELAPATTVRFDAADADAALLIGRYLEAAPQFVVEPGAELQLAVGPDFAGVRLFPRAQSDLEGILAAAVRASVADDPTATSTTAPDVDSEPETTGDSADETSVPDLATTSPGDLPSTVEAEEIDPPVDAQVASPLSTVVRGRPPEGVGCTGTGG